MKIKYTNIILIALVICFFQCKKKKDDAVVQPTAPTTAYTDICNPKTGNTQYIPLAIGNTWTYNALGAALPISITSTLSKDTTVTSGNKYFVATYTLNALPKSYQRYNSGDSLVGLNPDTLAAGKLREELLIPANPYVNQTWTDPKSTTYTVISVNANKTTANCTYTGLLQIQVYSPSYGTTSNYYYQKGTGLVLIECSGCNFTSAELKSMALN